VIALFPFVVQLEVLAMGQQLEVVLQMVVAVAQVGRWITALLMFLWLLCPAWQLLFEVRSRS
jgi:hypothetical protein